jgi:hypothetical protein
LLARTSRIPNFGVAVRGSILRRKFEFACVLVIRPLTGAERDLDTLRHRRVVGSPTEQRTKRARRLDILRLHRADRRQLGVGQSSAADSMGRRLCRTRMIYNMAMSIFRAGGRHASGQVGQ